MTKLVGLAGFSRCGKDTAAKNMPNWRRFAFADELKGMLGPIFHTIGCDLNLPDHKEKARPLMVALGATARAFWPSFWIDALFRHIDRHHFDFCAVITDVRYANEVKVILEKNGIVIGIKRPGIRPANEEEAASFHQIELSYPNMPVVENGSTPEELGRKVLELIK
jgi:hypothetical protein